MSIEGGWILRMGCLLLLQYLLSPYAIVLYIVDFLDAPLIVRLPASVSI
jgi:hypothetical protein